MTVPIPTMDKFTILGELGYNQPTLALRLDAFFKNLTALNTVGELLQHSLDQQMARDVLGITVSGTGSIQVPNEISATGTPGPTTFLAGDGSWKTIGAGSTTIALITDASPLAKDLLDEAFASTWLSKLGAVGLVLIGAPNGIAPLDSSSLLLDINRPQTWATKQDVTDAVDGVTTVPPDLSSYALKSELSATAIRITWNGTSWPPHPVTTRPIDYWGGPMPQPDGSPSGGGGMVPGVDTHYAIITGP